MPGQKKSTKSPFITAAAQAQTKIIQPNHWSYQLQPKPRHKIHQIPGHISCSPSLDRKFKIHQIPRHRSCSPSLDRKLKIHQIPGHMSCSPSLDIKSTKSLVISAVAQAQTEKIRQMYGIDNDLGFCTHSGVLQYRDLMF